jgi:nucleotide-binding universal stress UspA family protein
MKILLAVDGSKYTKRMLAYLATHPEMFGPSHEYHALFVPLQVPAHVVSAVGKSLVDDHYRTEAEKVFGPMDKFFARHELRFVSSMKPGAPGKRIAKMAEENKFDLVVMGSHGDGALKNLVMGSVTSSVLAQCTVPVLVVR